MTYTVVGVAVLTISASRQSMLILLTDYCNDSNVISTNKPVQYIAGSKEINAETGLLISYLFILMSDKSEALVSVGGELVASPRFQISTSFCLIKYLHLQITLWNSISIVIFRKRLLAKLRQWFEVFLKIRQNVINHKENNSVATYKIISAGGGVVLVIIKRQYEYAVLMLEDLKLRSIMFVKFMHDVDFKGHEYNKSMSNLNR